MIQTTVVIPTLEHRHGHLQNALDTVANQSYKDLQVWVMPDGPDSTLEEILQDSSHHGVRALWQRKRIKILPLGRHWPHYGHVNRLVAGYLCDTEYMAHLDDDNGWTPDHLETLIPLLKDHEFAYSQMRVMSSGQIVGDGEVKVGHIDSSVIVHRTELLRKSTWHPQEDDYVGDGKLAERWVAEGASYAFVPKVTVHYSTPNVSK